jgi:hypothetical protein
MNDLSLYLYLYPTGEFLSLAKQPYFNCRDLFKAATNVLALHIWDSTNMWRCGSKPRPCVFYPGAIVVKNTSTLSFLALAWCKGRPQKKDTSRVPSFIRCAARDLDVTAGIFFQGKCLTVLL